MPLTDITVYHLAMRDPGELKASWVERDDLQIVQAEIALPELSRFLYAAVGADWYWMLRLSWSYQQWLDWLERPTLQTWVAYIAGTPAGYFELDVQAEGCVEIAYFGLLPRFIGIGLGAHLLSAAIEKAWRIPGTKCVWLHTCTLDHPNALANYQARGLKIFKTEHFTEQLPDKPLGPWPGELKSGRFNVD